MCNPNPISYCQDQNGDIYHADVARTDDDSDVRKAAVQRIEDLS